MNLSSPRAAPVEIAVLLDQLERIDRPVLALRLDDVEMREQQDRLARAAAAQARDEIALARRGREDMHVGRRRSRPRAAAPPSPRPPCSVSPVAVTRVDLDQLLVDVARELLLRDQVLRRRRPGQKVPRPARSKAGSRTVSTGCFAASLLSSQGAPRRLEFRHVAGPFASAQATPFPPDIPCYFASFTAITSISTRNPGLASAATPTTERAGRFGWLPPKNWV